MDPMRPSIHALILSIASAAFLAAWFSSLLYIANRLP